MPHHCTPGAHQSLPEDRRETGFRAFLPVGTGFTSVPPCPGSASSPVALLLSHMPVEEPSGAGWLGLYPWHWCQSIQRACPQDSYEWLAALLGTS